MSLHVFTVHAQPAFSQVAGKVAQLALPPDAQRTADGLLKMVSRCEPRWRSFMICQKHPKTLSTRI